MQLTKINGKYELWLPEHRAARPEWSIENGGWEVARIEAMLSTIKKDDVVFDIGTEEGDISALIAKYTGCDMVLFEPNDRVWSCIKAIWTANKLKTPMGFFGGFLSHKSHGPRWLDYYFDSIGWENNREWSDELMPDHGFKQLYENYPDVSQVTLDYFCEASGIYPTVITMDVEGAEFQIMKGAQQVLSGKGWKQTKKPVIFMSVHPEFMYESYRNEGIWKERYGERQHVVHMLRFIDELGYTHRCIEYDYHELHMLFEPK